MMLNLFDQFLTPQLLGMPLMLMAMLLPTMLLTTQKKLMTNRIATVKLWLISTATKQLMQPINQPGHMWAMPLTMLIIYLMVTNLLGLLPYTFTPTTQLSLNMCLALPMWLMTVLTGLRTQPTHSLSHMLPTGTPPVLIPALIMIETTSLLIRPLALGVRLTANLTAGHLLIQLTSSAALALMAIAPTTTLITMVLLMLLTCLEIAVAMIQAYVFTLLLSLYLQENT